MNSLLGQNVHPLAAIAPPARLESWILVAYKSLSATAQATGDSFNTTPTAREYLFIIYLSQAAIRPLIAWMTVCMSGCCVDILYILLVVWIWG
jgi:hypothetical protein